MYELQLFYKDRGEDYNKYVHTHTYIYMLMTSNNSSLAKCKQRVSISLQTQLFTMGFLLKESETCINTHTEMSENTEKLPLILWTFLGRKVLSHN